MNIHAISNRPDEEVPPGETHDMWLLVAHVVALFCYPYTASLFSGLLTSFWLVDGVSMTVSDNFQME
jgi:hypothetical protein